MGVVQWACCDGRCAVGVVGVVEFALGRRGGTGGVVMGFE